ncbi:hypothetical protein IWW55_002174 [Coemansia sp. RSA 2706]|nr:hypothetical protein IWW55_002174 [Coemansia sp. RSA 2706]KAJ2314827.1 hypothetical protein IWW54_000686 [Coemansia sp. RSA 2705]
MDVSHTATIGRSHRGLNSMRDLQTMLAQMDSDDTADTPEPPPLAAATEPSADTSPSLSDPEDIDSDTAMNTVYNLLSQLGDLNRNNRRAAELLAEKFSMLQAKVSQAESLASSEAGRPDAASPEPPGSPRSAATFHTPPTTIGSLSLHIESPPAIPPATLPPLPILAPAYTQTELTSAEIARRLAHGERLDDENRLLRHNVELLVQSVREQQLMAKEYERTLAAALKALRAAAFERHSEISDVQATYRQLLDQEMALNRRLQSENLELKHALNNAAAAIKCTLADDDNQSYS